MREDGSQSGVEHLPDIRQIIHTIFRITTFLIGRFHARAPVVPMRDRTKSARSIKRDPKAYGMQVVL